jgi:HEAT repeat protein
LNPPTQPATFSAVLALAILAACCGPGATRLETGVPIADAGSSGVAGASGIDREQALDRVRATLLGFRKGRHRGFRYRAIALYARAEPPIEEFVANLRRLVSKDEYCEHEEIYEALAALGSDAAPAATGVVSALGDQRDCSGAFDPSWCTEGKGSGRADAILVLRKLGRAGIEALVDAAVEDRAPPDEVTACVVVALGPEAIAAFVVAAGDPAARGIRDVVDVLGLVGAEAAAATPAIVALLEHENAGLQWGAAQALGRIGPGADAAAPELRQLLGDEDHYLRLEAARALWRITGDDGKPLRVLKKGLKAKQPDVRSRAAEYLDAIGSAAAPAEKNLAGGEPAEPTTSDTVAPDQPAQSAATEDVQGLTRAELLDRLDATDHELRAAAAVALGRLGAADDETLTALVELLDDEHPLPRISAAEGLLRALGLIGPDEE